MGCKPSVKVIDEAYYSISEKKEQNTRNRKDIERDIIAAKCLTEYQFAQPLYDVEKGEVSEEAIKRFESLFVNNAKVYDDVSIGREGMMDFRDYVSRVYSFLKGQGVDGSITYYYDYGQNVSLTTLLIDDIEKQYYKYTYPVKKELRNGLDKNDKPVRHEKGEYREIDIEIIIISSLVTKEAKILAIKPR